MEKPMKRYRICFKYSNNGVLRSNMITYVKASSDAEAKRLVKSKYPDAKCLKIIGKWESSTTKTTQESE